MKRTQSRPTRAIVYHNGEPLSYHSSEELALKRAQQFINLKMTGITVDAYRTVAVQSGDALVRN